jgi:hypothetical protein
MANTRNDITIPEGVWTNLYTLSGITVGTAVTLVNKGCTSFDVAISAAAPTTVKGFPVFPGAIGSIVSIPAASTGLWGFSASGDSLVLIQE